MDEKTINWPAEFHPDNSGVHIENTLGMDVSAEKIWDCLIRVTDWPSFYPNASNVHILTGSKQHLEMGTRFRWKTFGMTIETTVVEFEPYERLAWEARSFGMRVYHAWLITPRGDGCHVRTEETQNGFLTRIASFLMPGNMHKQHQIWLETMNEAAKRA